MNILYVSDLSSERLNKLVYEKSNKGIGFAIQKFNRLVVRGLIEKGEKVELLSRPIVFDGITAKEVGAVGKESESRMEYNYIPCPSNNQLRYLVLLFYSFFYTLKWCFRTKGKKVVMCDILKPSICIGSLLACKLTGVQICAIVTDIPGYMNHTGEELSLISKVRLKINLCMITAYSKYILLTEAMNVVVNPHQHPYMIMEGLCDMSLIDDDNKVRVKKDNPPTVMYAGGVYEIYGLKMLVEGFIKANVDARLVIYGNGPYTKEIDEIHKFHPNVVYGGILPNDQIVDAEKRASLLINPRFSTEDYTKYSFPSKNMEYMASGTPLLTTKLHGMPKEYHRYVFLFDEETVEGYARAITKALEFGQDELREKGRDAKKFVLHNKNNGNQALRIIAFLK